MSEMGDFYDFVLDDYAHVEETFEEALENLKNKRLELEQYEKDFKEKWKQELRKEKIKKIL